MKKQNKQKGFIALFFILSVSFTFLTYISISSKRVFEYVYIKDDFNNGREYTHNTLLCADAFVNISIKTKHNLNIFGQKYDFTRNLYFKDNYNCKVTDINYLFENSKIKTIFFIIDNYGFEYMFENGFVKHIKTFNLL